MLIYHPAFDTHHCAFRLLRLLERLPKVPYPIEKIRILDFYLLFPSELVSVRFPQDALRFKKEFRRTSNPYERIEDPHRVFSRLEPIQLAALRTLASHGVIDQAQLSEGKALRSGSPIPASLARLIDTANTRFPAAIELLSGPLSAIDLYGKSGLKARTDLFEYRYDPS